MKIITSRFGELEVSEDQLFHFPMGLLGFASTKSFVIIDLGYIAQLESLPLSILEE